MANEFSGLGSVLNELFIESGLTPSELKKIVERISSDYISGRFNIRNDKEAIGYALYFLPEHIPKIYFVVKELDTRFGETLSKIVEIIDLGCGTATASLVMSLSNLKDRPVVLVDKNPTMLKIAEKIIQKTGKENIRTICADFLVNFEISNRASLYILMNTLSENINRLDKISSLISRILNANKNNFVIIIEPINITSKRLLVGIRERFSRYIIAPCINSGICPLAKKESDICRFNIRQEISIGLETVINSGHKMAKFYYLVMSQINREGFTNVYRVLEYPSVTKFGFYIKVCDGKDVYQIKILCKNSQEKRIIRCIKPDDIISIDNTELSDNVSLSPDKIKFIF